MHERNLYQDEVVIDLGLSYFGDAAIGFSLNGINEHGGIKNFKLIGNLRIVLKTSVSSSTLLEGIDISFLECPTYDFELTTALAPLNVFVSGDLLHSIIKEQLSNRLVFPNKIKIKLKDSSEIKEIPKIEGVLRVDLESVSGFVEFAGRAVSVEFSLKEQVSESPEYDVDADGVSKIKFQRDLVKYAQNDDILEVSVNIEDDNEELRSFKANINLSNLKKIGKVAGSFSLGPQGTVQIELSWFTLSCERNKLRIEPTRSSALLEVFIDSVRKLPKNEHAAFVEMSIEKQVQETFPLTLDTLSWKKHFAFFLSDPECDTLTVKLIDRLNSMDLGTCTYSIPDLMIRQKMEHQMQAFPLIKSVRDSEIVMSLRLRALTTSTIKINE